MSATVSSDFGLYKDAKNYPKTCSRTWTYHFVGVGLVCLLLLLTLVAAVLTKYRIQRLEDLERTNVSTISQKYHGLKSEVTKKTYPRPFQISFHGKQPTYFTITSTTTGHPLHSLPVSEMVPFGNIGYPHSIQEIIYEAAPQKKFNQNRFSHNLLLNKNLLSGSNQQVNNGHGVARTDPLLEFKPLHPGEINLMAIRKFRFGPPVWKIYSSKYQRDTLAQQFLMRDTGLFTPTERNLDDNKSIFITISVSPIEQFKKFLNFLTGMRSRLNKSQEELLTISLELTPEKQ